MSSIERRQSLAPCIGSIYGNEPTCFRKNTVTGRVMAHKVPRLVGIAKIMFEIIASIKGVNPHTPGDTSGELYDLSI